MSDASWLAWCFHNIYEELAPSFGYETRLESAVPFSQLPKANRNLMIATCKKLLDEGVITITYKDPHVDWPEPLEAPQIAEPLTAAEREALKLTGELATLVGTEVIVGPQAANDWAEFAQRIHAVQHMIMSQAAARAYPDEFRLLGGVLPPLSGRGDG